MLSVSMIRVLLKGRSEKRKGNGKRKDIQYQYFKYYTLNKNTLYILKVSEDIFTTTQIVSFGGLQKKMKKKTHFYLIGIISGAIIYGREGEH